MFEMILLKIAISVAVVLGVTYIAEKVSTRFAGILTGFPIGTAIVLFFLGLENGVEFASSSAVWAIGGIAAETVFVFCYSLGVRYFKKHSVIKTLVLSFAGFFGSALLLRQMPLSALVSSILLMSLIILSIFLYRRIKISNITKKTRTSGRSIFYRILATVAVVLVVTGISNVIGKEWSGLLASIPANLVIVLVIVHMSYSGKHVLTLIKGYPIGLIGLLIYLLSVPLTYSYFGVVVGTIVSYLIAGIYLVVYEFLIKKRIENYI